MDRYLHLFTVNSDTDRAKKYNISVDIEETEKDEGKIVLSCNCPAFVFKKPTGGRHCKHVYNVWIAINNADTLKGINAFNFPLSFADENKDWIDCADNWIPSTGRNYDNPSMHLGTVKRVGAFWRITSPIDPPFIPQRKIKARLRMCCSCDITQKIPIDIMMFTCKACGRLQRI